MTGKLKIAASLAAMLGATGAMAQDASLLPPDAKAGECYARVFTPTKETKIAKQVEVIPASEDLEVVPAVYRTVSKTVIVEEPSEELEVVPALFEDQQIEVEIAPAREEQEIVPAVWDEISERVLVRAAYQTWKKGTGPIQRYDEATGEIMCLVTVPAQYETVTRKVLKTPARVETRTIPAETRTITRKVMITPPQTRTIAVPAKTEVVEVQELVTPAALRKIPVPAEMQTVFEVRKAGDGQMQWRPILCETNAKADLIKDIQIALNTKGYAVGPADGVLGAATMRGVDRYQRESGLARGNLTLETIRALGINPEG